MGRRPVHWGELETRSLIVAQKGAPMLLWNQVRCAIRDGRQEDISRLAIEVEQNRELSEDVRSALKAQFMIARGKAQEARRYLTTRSKVKTLGPHEQLILGHLLLEAPVEAERLLHGAQVGLDDPRVAEGLGLAALERGNHVDAVRWLKKS